MTSSERFSSASSFTWRILLACPNLRSMHRTRLATLLQRCTASSQAVLGSQVEEQPIHTVSEHAELEGHGRSGLREETRRHRRATSKAHEHVVSFNLAGLDGEKTASVDLEAAFKKPQDKPPTSWVKRWPR